MTAHRFAAILAAGLLTLGGCKAAPAPTPLTTSAPAIPRVPEAWPFPLDRPAAEGERGMVVTDQALATDVGLAVLRDGGNAVDAAVATAFALAVTLPSAGNIGGGGFLVAHLDGQSYALDFRERRRRAPDATCTWTRRARPAIGR